MKKLTILILFLSVVLPRLNASEDEMFRFRSEPEMENAIWEFSELITSNKIKEACLAISREKQALSLYDSITPLEGILKDAQGLASVSIESVSFGDSYRSYGVLILFSNGYIAFFELQYVGNNDRWMNIRTTVDAKKDFEEVFKKVPKYFLKHNRLRRPGSEFDSEPDGSGQPM